jgi:hypothetical protein
MPRRKEAHIVEQEFDSRFHALLRESWKNKQGVLDRSNGPAVIEFNPETYAVARESWYRDGALHRDNGPAYVEYNLYGRTLTEVWYKNGVCGRDDHPSRRGAYRGTSGGPAVVEYDPTTRRSIREEWRTLPGGNLHRKNGPAVIERDSETGTITKAAWFQGGRAITVRPKTRRAFLARLADARHPYP